MTTRPSTATLGVSGATAREPQTGLVDRRRCACRGIIEVAIPVSKRIQRSRAKGWRMPPNTAYVGRPTRWGNPYRIGDVATINHVPFKLDQAAAVALFRLLVKDVLRGDPHFLNALRGKDLACWCLLSVACHADVLLELANA